MGGAWALGVAEMRRRCTWSPHHHGTSSAPRPSWPDGRSAPLARVLGAAQTDAQTLLHAPRGPGRCMWPATMRLLGRAIGAGHLAHYAPPACRRSRPNQLACLHRPAPASCLSVAPGGVVRGPQPSQTRLGEADKGGGAKHGEHSRGGGSLQLRRSTSHSSFRNICTTRAPHSSLSPSRTPASPPSRL